MSSTERGRRAEQAAGAYLTQAGFSVQSYNWRTRFCEIDIVAQKGQTMHFVEVKYRQSARQGTGLEYITAHKLRHMRFAAESWVAANQWEGEYVLSAIEVSGDDYRVEAFIENV